MASEKFDCARCFLNVQYQSWPKSVAKLSLHCASCKIALFNNEWKSFCESQREPQWLTESQDGWATAHPTYVLVGPTCHDSGSSFLYILRNHYRLGHEVRHYAGGFYCTYLLTWMSRCVKRTVLNLFQTSQIQICVQIVIWCYMMPKALQMLHTLF